MAELRIPRAHSDDWYDHLSTVQDGYYYPWESTLDPRNGESAFDAFVIENLSPDDVVLEVACGHGDFALSIAEQCQKVIAYDRVAAYIDIANRNKASAGVDNVEFLCHNALDVDGNVELPVANGSVSKIVCRLGPHHWIQDAKRACHKGAEVVALSPMEEPIPAWTSVLPHVMHYENSGRYSGSGSIHQSVDNRLHQAGLTLHGGWGFDVPETFADKTALYTMVTWGLPGDRSPLFEDVSEKLDIVFSRYAEPSGIVLRQCRYLWNAFVT